MYKRFQTLIWQRVRAHRDFVIYMEDYDIEYDRNRYAKLRSDLEEVIKTLYVFRSCPGHYKCVDKS